MTCESSKFPDGGTLWMCGDFTEPPCSVCKRREATKLCDWRTEGGTCDAALCDGCAVIVARVDGRPAFGDALSMHAHRALRHARSRRNGKQTRSAAAKRCDEAMRSLAAIDAGSDTVDHCPSHGVSP